VSGERKSLFASEQGWEWFGNPGHFICARDCQFHLCTLVGPWLVSTVGEYFPDETSRQIHADVRGIKLEGRGDERRADFMRKCGYVEIGFGRTYETMVFRTDGTRCDSDDCRCGMPKVAEWSELDAQGYSDRGDAQRGHYAMCRKWAEVGSGDLPPEDWGIE
jgi:hypothetical protein